MKYQVGQLLVHKNRGFGKISAIYTDSVEFETEETRERLAPNSAEFWLREPTREELHEHGEDCGEEKCQTCCPHSDSRDHGICIDCGQEEDPGEAIDRAMDALEDR